MPRSASRAEGVPTAAPASSAQPRTVGPLDGLRVLDLTRQIAGPYCTKLLADYGADVVKVEPPRTGDPVRSTPPFHADRPDPEGGLLHLYLNTNKRSVALDLRTPRGRALLLELARDADVLVESCRPGAMDRLGLGFDVLHEVNPRLVYTSVSSFGQTGPYRDLPASELVLYAMSGMMAISGRVDLEPLKHGLSQGQYGAGATAAHVTATAVLAQALGSPGQWLDVSVLETLSSELVLNEPFYAWSGGVQGRRPAQGDGLNNIMACRDGHVVLQISGKRPWSSIVELLDMPELDDPRFATGEGRALHAVELDGLLAGRLAVLGKKELFEQATARRMLFGVAQGPADLLACPQLAARDYFVQVDHPTTGPLPYPGPPVRLSRTPWTLRRPAPLLGQHTAEVLTPLLAADETLEDLEAAGVC
jgi:crotonobetainyl-CoA:carnitine CoA-transferase CaiB-like acyl-CoA transferase